MDYQFLHQIQSAFFGNNVTPNMMAMLGTVLMAMFLAMVAGWLLNRWLDRRRGTIPLNWIVGRARIQELIQSAFDQRARFDMLLEHNAARSRFIPCELIEIGAETLAVELSASVRLSQEWLGRRADVFFKVKTRDMPQPQYFGFTSEIVAIGLSEHGNSLATMEFPEKVEARQKRSHLRIEPPSGLVHGLLLWPEPEASGASAASDMRGWGEPVVTYSPPHASGDGNGEGAPAAHDVRMVNISGGGLRFEIPPAAMESRRPTSFTLGERFVLCLDLYDPRDKDIKRSILRAKVRNIYDGKAEHGLEVGLEFLAEGRKDAEAPDIVHWHGLAGDSGVEAIDNWVFRRHLEMHREKGIA
ncbi:type IV pilus assembly PilZ [Desulfovibrio sp. X2]|uniref:PilZ domain-containing protein n=1 Tax=Desulfovibrio sp. X2 TaxID=941449 RepID=UPI0003589265|nr:PilZ domain-containing protein [Desulfovibrio sp. X2]EPR42350.1 type IV pilus assembly PilZ [Desulfovibrio sp. X2]